MNLKEQQTRQENLFLERFHEFSESVVKTAFEEIAIFSKAKGLNYKINRQKDITAHDGKHTRASISICFYFGEDSHRPFHEYPNLSITCNKYQQAVALHQSTISPKSGGQAGPIGEFQIETLTIDFIQNKLIDLLQKAFT